MDLTTARLRELISYDPQSGIFTWRVAPSNSIKIGQKAGSLDGKGYVLIGIAGRRYQASRLVFFWMTGRWPKNDAEHRDGDSQNNRWGNLRDATVPQNMHNKRVQSNNICGLKGVSLFLQKGKPTGKWRSRIKAVSGEQVHLGLFDCPAAAHLAYVVAAEKNFGEFARAA